MATIDLPAVDSNVTIVVTAMNEFGSGPGSAFAEDKISELHIYLIEHAYFKISVTYVCR